MILTRQVRLSAVGFVATCLFLLAPGKPAQACAIMQIEVTHWLVCATSGGVIISCYRTTTRALVPAPGGGCRAALPPNDGLISYGGGGGGGALPNPIDQNNDNITDCWNDLTTDQTAPITSPFGVRPAPMPGASTNHNGIDIGVPTGTGLRAGQNGRIVEIFASFAVGTGTGNGNFVRINYDDGTQGVYLHMESVLVANGDRVTVGQVIGTSNNTGTSSNPHLHYSIWKKHNHSGGASNLSNFHDPAAVHGACAAPTP